MSDPKELAAEAKRVHAEAQAVPFVLNSSQVGWEHSVKAVAAFSQWCNAKVPEIADALLASEERREAAERLISDFGLQCDECWVEYHPGCDTECPKAELLKGWDGTHVWSTKSHRGSREIIHRLLDQLDAAGKQRQALRQRAEAAERELAEARANAAKDMAEIHERLERAIMDARTSDYPTNLYCLLADVRKMRDAG